MSRIVSFVKDWALPIVMGAGVAAYFVFSAVGFNADVRQAAESAVGVVQPLLLFAMLYISFCKIDPPKSVRTGGTCGWRLFKAVSLF